MNAVSRKRWGARAPKSRTRNTKVTQLFLHWNGGAPRSFRHINTEAEERELMRSTQRFHMDTRGWSDFAYSYAIMPSGRVYMGRGMGYVPASQAPHNTGTASVIVFIGPDDPLTGRVEDAVKRLRKHVEKHAGQRVAVRAHRDVNATTCPGDKLAALSRRI
jgi:hypothetical protein